MTPLMQQYLAIKKRFQDCILLFRLGDFYEMFFEEAEEVSRILGIKLTARQEIPMCGIPYGNIDFYLKKLLDHNKKVAFCEQIDSSDSSKIMERDVIRIVTRSTFVDYSQKDYNFLLAIKQHHNIFQLCYFDMGTNESFYEETEASMLFSTIIKINPTEIITSEKYEELNIFDDICRISHGDSAQNLLKNYLHILKYDVTINPINKNSEYMDLGSKTLDNLEIIQGKLSLFTLLDKTQTPMGRRLLKDILVRPLINQKNIENRLNTIENYIQKIKQGEFIPLKIGDLPKNYYKIKNLNELEDFVYSLDELLNKNYFGDNFIIDYKQKIEFEKSQIQILIDKQKQILEKISILQENYEKLLGIKIKIKNNNLIGYFIEIRKNITVSKDFILKQGLVDCSRYTSQDLLLLEQEINEIQLEINEKNQLAFERLKHNFPEENFKKLINIISWLDFYQSSATVAIEYKYFKPQFNNQNIFIVQKGRHALIEKTRNFIYNDLDLNDIWIITGPNMGGKSTFLRQNALIVLMAQCGLFVPGEVNMPIFKSLFVRMGASDNITMGDSTFMTEMKECAEILHKATAQSFVILDEVGRGTGLKDGLAVSIAIIEYLHDIIRCKALISTHYNELSSCENYLSRLENHCVYIENNKLMFKITKGISKSSHGLFVAQIANLPDQIIQRSNNIENNIVITVNVPKEI